MGKDVNQFIGTGRLGADPESRNVRDGGIVTNIRIACDNSYKDRDGKEHGSVEWIPIVIFGHAAEFVDKYLKKGDGVTVRGKFQTRKWQDRDGKDRYSTEIVVDNFSGEIIAMGGGGGGSKDRDRDDRSGDRDRGSDRGRGRNDDRDRDDDRRSDRRDDDRGRGGERGGRDDRGRDDRGGSDRGRDRDDDRGSKGRDRDDRDRGRAGSKEMEDEIPF